MQYMSCAMYHYYSILNLAVGAAKQTSIRQGDRLLEVNGVSVRQLSHKEAGQVISDYPHRVTLLLHTRKPVLVPRGHVVYSGWLEKRGGTGMTPRNWRRRWFVLRDDCIAYYYSGPEVRGVRIAVDVLQEVSFCV